MCFKIRHLYVPPIYKSQINDQFYKKKAHPVKGKLFLMRK